MAPRRKSQKTSQPLLVNGLLRTGSVDGPIIAQTRAVIMVADDVEGTQITYVQSMDTFSFTGTDQQVFATYEVLPGEEDPIFQGPISTILKGGMGCPVRENGVMTTVSASIQSSAISGRGFLLLSSDKNPGTPFPTGNLYEFELGRTFAFIPAQ